MSRFTENEFSPHGKSTLGDSRLLTKQQLADDLQVTIRTLDRWLLDGNLPPDTKIKVGRVVRFHKEAIQAWLDSRIQSSED